MIAAEIRYAVARLALGLNLCSVAAPNPLFAQAAPAPSSQLQLRSSDAGAVLASAMSKLASDPRDLGALVAAGEAALHLDDPRSALGFFGRADDISPNNGRVKAGLGRSMLQLEQIGDGLRLMEQAGNLGYSDAELLADRGLARDLTGNQTGAQQDYLSALRLDPANERIIRRYAVSLGISGQLDRAEKTIQPLLYKSDRAAWRDRAFILAMNGRAVEANQITGRVMPKALADAMRPYMDRMSMLSPGQRAAAVHLGQFPPGLVNMRVVSTAVPVKITEAAPAPDAGKKNRKRNAPTSASISGTAMASNDPPLPPAYSAPAPEPVAQETPKAVVQAPAPAPTSTPAPASAPRLAPTPRAAPAPVTVAAAPRAVQGPPAPEPAAPVSRPAPLPASTSVPIPATAPAASTPEPTPAPAPAAPLETTGPDRTLAEIMAGIEIPDAERQRAVAPVNLAEIAAMQAQERKAAEAKARKDAETREAARLKAEAAAKAKAAAAAETAEKKRLAANPARYWVQIGVGRDKSALGFTLRRMKKEHASLAQYDGWSAAWGRTNRLVVGPFKSLDKAKAVEGELKKAGSDAFVWRSDAGEELDTVGAK